MTEAVWRVTTERQESLCLDDGSAIAIVESFGYGWYANACPPQKDGISSSIPGWIRAGNFRDNVEAARAWCERICGLHPEKPGDGKSEGSRQEIRG